MHSQQPAYALAQQAVHEAGLRNTAGAWVDVAPVPDSIIVNVGDMLQFWSNDLFKSTRHRVVKPGKERYSCAFFVSADHDAQVFVEMCTAAAVRIILLMHQIWHGMVVTFPFAVQVQ